MIETVDPFVWIEEQRTGYIRYQLRDRAGVVIRRWEQRGVCSQLGTCMTGAVPWDEGWKPRDQRLDVPCTPELDCKPCSRGRWPKLRFVEL